VIEYEARTNGKRCSFHGTFLHDIFDEHFRLAKYAFCGCAGLYGIMHTAPSLMQIFVHRCSMQSHLLPFCRILFDRYLLEPMPIIIRE